MSHHHLDPPRISATVLDANTHHVNVIGQEGQALTALPSGASVMEVWVANVPAGLPLERAYASFSWMKPSTSLPVVVKVSSVTGRDPMRGPPGRWHLFYKARWVRDGVTVSSWSNVIAVEDTQSAETRANAPGGHAPV